MNDTMHIARMHLQVIAVIASLLALFGCEPKLDPDTLYGVWKGNSKQYGPTLITFISKGRCELQHYRNKDSKIKVGSWRINGNAVVVSFETYPRLSLLFDRIELEDGEMRERLTDRTQGIEVVKM